MDPVVSRNRSSGREGTARKPEFAPDPDWLVAHREGSGSLPDLGGQRLVRLDLRGLDLRGLRAEGADFSRSDLSGANLFSSRLEGATFYGSRLDGTEFGQAKLAGANLEGAIASRAGFGGADLGETRLSGARFEEASLTEVRLESSQGIGVSFRGARLAGARLSDAELPGADFSAADLTGADVAGAELGNVDLREARVGSITGYETAQWIGADVRGVDCSHAYGFRRFVADQNFLDEFRQKSPWIHRIWDVSCDCGRSAERWTAWTMLLILVYAFAYTQADVDFGSDATWFSPIYFSAVTMTTLGYGDITPVSVPAQMLAVSQAILGYVMLGGLLSILSAKLARRAE